MKRICLLFSLLGGLAALGQDSALYREAFRPRYHFSPARNWTNDPNGFVYTPGGYQLFYQYNPLGNRWGHMTWGHASSRDLLHWEHLPPAIPEENGIMIFSGTCITDTHNSSGLGKPGGPAPMVAIYTGHQENLNQSQCLAYSLDRGRTWTKYAGNPILDLHKKDFRDPKVFWYGPGAYWVMAVVLPLEHQVRFYKSGNLTAWEWLSDFGPAGDTSGVWECPDLSRLPVAGSPGQYKWVLMTSQNASMQYFVGDFDGRRLVAEPAGSVNRPDYGPDYYAAITCNQLPEGKAPISIGWVNNWNYANEIPTSPWKGAMSLPRECSLKKTGAGWKLYQQPPAAFASLRGPAYQGRAQWMEGKYTLPRESRQFELGLQWQPGAGINSGLRIAAGAAGYLEIGYDNSRQVLYLDRSRCPHPPLPAAFDSLSRFETPLKLVGKALSLRVFVDHSIVEVFANGGEKVLTAQFFAPETEQKIVLFSDGRRSYIESLKYYPINSIWKQ